MEDFSQTQGGVELWPGLLLLGAWLVPYRLCRPTAPPTSWSALYTLSIIYLTSSLNNVF